MAFLYCAGDIDVLPNGTIDCTTTWQSLTDEEVVSQLDISSLASLYELLNSVFSTPETDALTTAWWLGFFVPVLAYLASSQYGVVINWFNSKRG